MNDAVALAHGRAVGGKEHGHTAASAGLGKEGVGHILIGVARLHRGDGHACRLGIVARGMAHQRDFAQGLDHADAAQQRLGRSEAMALGQDSLDQRRFHGKRAGNARNSLPQRAGGIRKRAVALQCLDRGIAGEVIHRVGPATGYWRQEYRRDRTAFQTVRRGEQQDFNRTTGAGRIDIVQVVQELAANQRHRLCRIGRHHSEGRARLPHGHRLRPVAGRLIDAHRLGQDQRGHALVAGHAFGHGAVDQGKKFAHAKKSGACRVLDTI